MFPTERDERKRPVSERNAERVRAGRDPDSASSFRASRSRRMTANSQAEKKKLASKAPAIAAMRQTLVEEDMKNREEAGFGRENGRSGFATTHSIPKIPANCTAPVRTGARGRRGPVV